jgi:hypothetical protein
MGGKRSCLTGVLALLVVTGGLACGGKREAGEPIVTVTSALTVTVGPGKQFASLQAAQASLQPGDVVLVDPVVYTELVRFTRPGQAGNPITIRGVLGPNGERPVLRPPSTMTASMNVVHFNQSHHYVFENVEIDATGATFNSDTSIGVSRCIFHEANDITLRNVFVHDCPAQGILGADDGSGSLTLEFSEVARCGSTDRHHNVYIATDPTSSGFPGSVFRMRYSYIHDSNHGNLVKSRAERNEIYYNWIENGAVRELELIGRDLDTPPQPGHEMHSDVVGNVIAKTIVRLDSNPIRLGHDWDGSPTAGTHGKYRLVNNTIVTSAGTGSRIIRLMGWLRSVEMHNNVFYKQGEAVDVLLATEPSVSWSGGSRQVAGQRNWVPTGSIVPSEWTETRTGANPGFVGARDFQLLGTSVLKDQGTTAAPVGFPSSPFPNPLYPPQFVPPVGQRTTVATSRPVSGTIDIGAYEGGSGTPCSFALGSNGTTIAAAGGTGNVSVTAGAGCPWTASSGAAWVTITAGATGSGNGTVSFSVQQNTGAERTATLTIAGMSFTITQSPAACSYSLSPPSVQVGASGTTGSVAVTAGAGCAWSAQSNAPWLTITAGASGSGDGTVTYNVGTNNTGSARSGAITVSGQTHTVNQAAAPPTGSLIEVYSNQTNVVFAGGSAGVQAAVVAGEGVGGSNAVKHTVLQIWDASKRLQLPTPVDISTVQTGDKLRISLDVSAGRVSNIHIFFNGDWQTFLISPVLDQTAGYQTFDIDIPADMRTRMGNAVNDIYFKAGSGFPDNGTLWVDDIKFVRNSSSPPPGALGEVYSNQTSVTFDGGSAGVQAAVVAGEGVGGSHAVKHTALQIWDASKRLQLPAPVDITGVQATDKLRISLDVSPGRVSNIHIFFNGDWQTFLISPVLDQSAGYQTFDIDIGTAMRTRMGNSVNGIYFKAGSGFPDNGTLWVDDIKFVRP